jgi:hypothetical protein
MVRLREIITRTDNGTLLDLLRDEDLAPIIYKLYNDLLILSDNMLIMPYEMRSQSKINHLKNIFIDIKIDAYETFYKPSDALLMMNEMSLYFDL